MAKPYDYMSGAEYSIYSFGILIKPFAGTVETTWKVPTKYQGMAEVFIDTHFNNAIHPSVQYVYKETLDGTIMVVTFTRSIDFSQVFVDLEGSSLDKYNQVMTMRDEAINEACFQLTRSKESFQDMIRGKFYTTRFVNNAPSIP